MRVLALDTTTRDGSVAVVEDDRVLVERGGDPARTHGERLPGEILIALHDAGFALQDVDVFAVAVGPGSFTGLRVGIATIQGLALVGRRRVVPVSALLALAQAGSRELPVGARIGAWMDAHRGEVFSALYQIAEGSDSAPAHLVELDPPSVADPALTIDRWGAGPPINLYIGDGAVLYRKLIDPRSRAAPAPLLAGTIGIVAEVFARDGATVDPAGVQPLYVRRPDAEIDRERKRVLGR